MKKYYNYIFIPITIITILLSYVFIQYRLESTKFVTSKHSKYCYLKGDENHNIKEKIYYQSLEECNKPLKI